MNTVNNTPAVALVAETITALAAIKMAAAHIFNESSGTDRGHTGNMKACLLDLSRALDLVNGVLPKLAGEKYDPAALAATETTLRKNPDAVEGYVPIAVKL